jgi:hypothetical protein
MTEIEDTSISLLSQFWFCGKAIAEEGDEKRLE